MCPPRLPRRLDGGSGEVLRTPGTVSSKMRHFQSKVKGGPENTLMTSAFRLTTVIRRYLIYLCKQQFSMIFLVKTCFQDVLVIKKKIKKIHIEPFLHNFKLELLQF